MRGALMAEEARALLRRLHPGAPTLEQQPPPPPHPAAPVPPTSLEILVVNISAAGTTGRLEVPQQLVNALPVLADGRCQRSKTHSSMTVPASPYRLAIIYALSVLAIGQRQHVWSHHVIPVPAPPHGLADVPPLTLTEMGGYS